MESNVDTLALAASAVIAFVFSIENPATWHRTGEVEFKAVALFDRVRTNTPEAVE